MSDAFEQLNSASASAYLASLNHSARQKGERYYKEGRVTDLVSQESGFVYSASVQGAELYHVELGYEEAEGWYGDCSCPVGGDCQHAYAAMKALLAEHSGARVRQLSAGASAVQEVQTGVASARPASGNLADAWVAALGRKLTPDELRFLGKVRKAYARCQASRRISHFDFDDMGLSLGGYGWEQIDLWPAFPENEHKFWLYVASAVQQRGRPIPLFTRAITDLKALSEELARWRRKREVDRWRQTLGNHRDLFLHPPTLPGHEIDLRLLIESPGAQLQWKAPGQDLFATVRPGTLRQLLHDDAAGLLSFSPECELLWDIFRERAEFGQPMDLLFVAPRVEAILSRLLRLRALESRVVRPDGLPLDRPGEPLHWEMIPATSDDGDYRLRLVCGDGSPPPEILLVLAGHPTLYLTALALFKGPPARLDHLLHPREETSIPAPAIESRNGVAFLRSLGVAMPERLRERIQTVPFQVAITCQLRPTFPESRVEECVVRASAETSDGCREFWNGTAWIAESKPPRDQQNQKAGAILLHDRALLPVVSHLLATLGLKANPYNGELTLRVTKKFPEMFAAWLKTVPPNITVHLSGELASFASAEVAGRVKLEVTEAEIDWFDLRVVLDVSDTTLTPEELKLLLDAKGGFVRLAGKGWRRMQFDLTAEEEERLARLGLSPREMTSEPQRLHALQLADEAAAKFLPAQQADEVQRRASEIKARVTPELPSGLTADLRPYQLEGFHFLAYLSTNRFGGVLADDMGLGKTLQTLVWLAWLRAAASGPKVEMNPVLVVCPKSVMDNWQADAARFTQGLRVRAWRAGELPGLLDELASADVHVLNYSQLRSLGESLIAVRWLAVVLDEGQYIKNPSSQTAQIARALHAEHRLVLSGTPIENRLLDLWSIMAFTMPGVLGSRNQFARLYDAKGDPFARRRLSSRVRPFLLRRTKTQVAKDLPDRIEEDLFCEMEGEQKALYRAELKRAQQMLLAISTQKQLAQERFHFLTSLLRLRQICCHPALVKPGSKAPSAKAEALLEQLDPIMAEGNKVLVFSQFVELIRLVEPEIAQQGWTTFVLTGDTEDRGELVRRFQSAEGAAVFLISLKAGGFGLNLTAASYVMLFDPWWNPAVENQAIDRTHRIGQTNKVIAYRLLMKESIEEKIRALQKQKKFLAEDVLGEEKFAQSLTIDDLHFLLAD